MEINVGLRVVRGPDWEWGNLDGGEGHVGTVVEVEDPMNGGRPVIVQWDTGYRCRYRCGVGGKYDLRVLDSAPTGLQHQFVQCDGCGYDGVTGMRWKCVKCYDFDLCSLCYMTGKHDTSHPFQRYDNLGVGVRVPPRAKAKKCPATGLYPGAEVVRGVDWSQGNEDGGEGKTGKILILKGWKQESFRSAIEVKWDVTGEKSLCRVGHEGKVDVKCTKPFSLGSYYPEHLSVLGATASPSKSDEFASGDFVRVELDLEVFRMLQEVHGEWSNGMGQLIGKLGTVHSILDSGELMVTYGGSDRFTINPNALVKANECVFTQGEVVQILEDRSEVVKLQAGFGGWNEDMIETLGQFGVVHAQGSSCVIVVVNGRKWAYSPQCLRRINSDDDK